MCKALVCQLEEKVQEGMAEGGGNVPKHHACFYPTWQELDWHSSLEKGAQSLMNTDPSHWSRAWFRLGTYCDSVDNNLCESFNKWIVEGWRPDSIIITMLEMIRRKVMARIQENSTKVDRWPTMIWPNILKKLNVYITQFGFCHAISNGNDKYEVVHYESMTIGGL